MTDSMVIEQLAQGLGTEEWMEQGLAMGRVGTHKLNPEVVTETSETTEIGKCVATSMAKLDYEIEIGVGTANMFGNVLAKHGMSQGMICVSDNGASRSDELNGVDGEQGQNNPKNMGLALLNWTNVCEKLQRTHQNQT